jgi:hypothetical protein
MPAIAQGQGEDYPLLGCFCYTNWIADVLRDAPSSNDLESMQERRRFLIFRGIYSLLLNRRRGANYSIDSSPALTPLVLLCTFTLVDMPSLL